MPATGGAGRRKSGRMPREIPDAFIFRSRFSGLRFPAERRRKTGPKIGAAIRGRRGSAHHRTARPRRHVPDEPGAGDGEAWAVRREPEGLRLRGNVERGVRVGDAGAGARRFRSAQLCLGPVGAGDVSDLCVRIGCTEGQMAPATTRRQSDWLLRAYRAAVRLQSRRDADPCGENRR